MTIRTKAELREYERIQNMMREVREELDNIKNHVYGCEDAYHEVWMRETREEQARKKKNRAQAQQRAFDKDIAFREKHGIKSSVGVGDPEEGVV